MMQANNKGTRKKIMLMLALVMFSLIIIPLTNAGECDEYEGALNEECNGPYKNQNNFDDFSKYMDAAVKAGSTAESAKQYVEFQKEQAKKAEAEKEDMSWWDKLVHGKDDDPYGLIIPTDLEDDIDEWCGKDANDCSDSDDNKWVDNFCKDRDNCNAKDIKQGIKDAEAECSAANHGLKCDFVGADMEYEVDEDKMKMAFEGITQDFVTGWMERGAFELIKKSAFAKVFTYAGIVEGCIDEYLSGQANVGLGDVDLSGVGQPSSNDMNVGVDYDCDSNWYNYATGDFNCSYSALLSEGTGLLDAAMEKIMNSMQNIHILGLFNEEVTPNGRQFRYAYAGAISAPESSTWGIFLKNSETEEMETLDQVFVQYSPDNFEIPMMKETFVMQDFFNCICANKTATGQHFCFQLVGRKCGMKEIEYYDDVTGVMEARNVTDCNRMEFYNNEGRKSCNG